MDGPHRRYDTLLADCAAILQCPTPNWHIQHYTLETRLGHCIAEGDWGSLSHELLHHPGLVIWNSP
ncbi:MAG: hypothetical protein N2508_09465 [Anaerolineae bacterium]|nr:hypothetical protein [Anaerolineae bacterium]